MIFYLIAGAIWSILFIIQMSKHETFSFKRAVYYFVTMTMLAFFTIYFVFKHPYIIRLFGKFMLVVSTMTAGALILMGEFLYQERQDKKRKRKMYKTEPAHSPEEMEILTEVREILLRKIEQDRKEAREQNEPMVRDWRKESLRGSLAIVKGQGRSQEQYFVGSKENV
ncbi:MAG: hypothetical protein Q4A75_08560 [Peptostreptococcaceae bacterium]|nr:hypothetical protein [Peptostreptococcaceae bacterium]